MVKRMKTTFPDDFRVTEDMKLWAQEKTPNVDIQDQTERFCDYWRAHGKKMADWVATWRNWMRRAPEFAPKVQSRVRWRAEVH